MTKMQEYKGFAAITSRKAAFSRVPVAEAFLVWRGAQYKVSQS